MNKKKKMGKKEFWESHTIVDLNFQFAPHSLVAMVCCEFHLNLICDIWLAHGVPNT